MQAPDMKGLFTLFIVGLCLIPVALWKIIDGIIWIVRNINITIG